MSPLPEDRFLCGFSHIFAGGYSAGYFRSVFSSHVGFVSSQQHSGRVCQLLTAMPVCSYKWAEVLSADAFSAFEEAGLEDQKAVAETGRRFRDTVLALGGGLEPAEVFKQFRGREPSTEPLLRHSDLLVAATA